MPIHRIPAPTTPPQFTFELNGTTYRLVDLEDWTLRQDEIALQLIKEFLPLLSNKMESATMLDIIDAIIQSRTHTKLLAVCFLPEGQDRFTLQKYEELIDPMLDAPNKALKEAISRFFTGAKRFSQVASLISTLKTPEVTDSPKTTSDS